MNIFCNIAMVVQKINSKICLFVKSVIYGKYKCGFLSDLLSLCSF